MAVAGGVLLLSSCGGCDATVNHAALPTYFSSPGSFDDVEIDQAGHRLYVADRGHKGVTVVDISGSTPRFAGTVDVGGSPNGLAVAPDLKRVFAGLASGAVVAIDTDSASKTFMKVVDGISVDKAEADLMDYSAKAKLLFVGTGSGGTVASVDPTTSQVTGRIDLKSAVEQPRFDPADGMLYVTAPDADALFRIDPVKEEIVNTYKLDGCKPSGLAINPTRELALIACTGSAMVMDLRKGSHWLTSGVRGGDVVSYDAGADRFVVASPHINSPSAVGVFRGDGHFLSATSTDSSGHAAAYDGARGVVYTTGAAGLMSFTPGACLQVPEWMHFAAGLAAYATPFGLLAIAIVLYPRWRKRARNKAPKKASTKPARQSWRQRQREDLLFARERMREIEDGILGAEPEPAVEAPAPKPDPMQSFLNPT